MKAIICKCGCPKSKHYWHHDYGANKGECRNCSWGNPDDYHDPIGYCDGFTAKYCAVKDCNEERAGNIFIYCKKHLELDTDGKLDVNGEVRK
ncbi:MAG: hypothetical protein GTO44_10075 [Hydrotalea flava]|nr:hypothetical protein [Hydrotalea flava]NIN15400.1 hypothetical protein [Hydrotalea flava]